MEKEYEILNGDRQQAVHIFVNAIIAASAFLGVAFFLMIKSETSQQAIAAGGAGIVLLGFFIIVVVRCRMHDRQLHQRLTDLGEEVGYGPVISTKYIFDTVLIFGFLLMLYWLAVGYVKATDPTKWVKDMTGTELHNEPLLR